MSEVLEERRSEDDGLDSAERLAPITGDYVIGNNVPGQSVVQRFAKLPILPFQ
jgi:hypothetical protein